MFKICWKLTCSSFNSYFQFLYNSCVSISAFASLFDIALGITSSAVGINICAITAGIEKCKSMIKKKKKKHDKIVLLIIDKLNTITVLIYKALIDSYISHDKFVSVNNVLREYNEMKKLIKNSQTSVEYIIYKKNGNLQRQL